MERMWEGEEGRRGGGGEGTMDGEKEGGEVRGRREGMKTYHIVRTYERKRCTQHQRTEFLFSKYDKLMHNI